MSPGGGRPEGEPASAAEARAWVERRIRAADRFAALADATERHRAEHRCNAWASADGPLLGVLARATGARRILEIGTALGYSAAWLAQGAPDARIGSFDADPSHAEAARAQLGG
jgi:predicted O-methyltransferase YrrM